MTFLKSRFTSETDSEMSSLEMLGRFGFPRLFVCVRVRGGPEQLCGEQEEANPGVYFLHLLALKRRRCGGDTVGCVRCWPWKKSWRLITTGVSGGWSVSSARAQDAVVCAVTPQLVAPAGAGTAQEACGAAAGGL